MGSGCSTKIPKLITYNTDARITNGNRYMGYAEELFELKQLNNSCPVLYIVNSPASAPKLLENMSELLGFQSVFVHVDELYTYDNSHLDKPNSEKWAKPFIKNLDLAIDNCLAGKKRRKPKTIDLSAKNIIGKTDFETWRKVANAAVIDKGATAPDGSQNADIVEIPNPGAKLQRVFREQKIEKGSTMTYSVWLWSDRFVTARIQMIRSCSSKTPMEMSSKVISITPSPQRFDIAKTFENDHECGLIQIVWVASWD